MPFPWIRCGGRGARRLGLVLLAVPFFAGPVAATNSDRSGFISLVEGAAAVERAASQEPAAENQPLRSGDRLKTARGGRVEVVLADGTLIHVDSDSDLVFAELAGPNEGDPQSNLVLLERGELLLASFGETETRIDTDNATVYVGAGAYRLERDDLSTRVIVRHGEAELRTRSGAVSLAEGNQAAIEGDGALVVEPAGGPDVLERWAAALFELRERWAWCPQCRRGYWSFGEEDSGLDFVFTDFGAWDDGAPGCFEHPDGGARRTRPPHPPTDDPDRVGVPIAGGPGLAPGGAVEAPVTKPWPLEDSSAIDTTPTPVAKPPLEPDDSWLAASVGGAFAEPPAVTAAQVEASGDEGWRLESTASSEEESPSSDAPADTSVSAVSTTETPVSEVSTTDDSSSSISTTDSPAATADTSWASDTSASSAPAVEDTGSSGSGFVEAPSARDPGIEPNR
jgi:FecR-like protein